MLSGKQLKMIEMAEATAKNTSKMEEILRKQKLIEERRKAVFDALSILIDPVDNEELLKHLPIIDSSKWQEIVEERFITKLCGFPTCSKAVDNNPKFQKYCIDRKTKKVYENSSDRQKYCSDRCFELSIGVRAQLTDQPFWMTGTRLQKKYDLRLQKKETPLRIGEEIIVKPQVPVITQLGDLKIAESAETDDEAEVEDHCNTEALEISDFLSTKPSCSMTSPTISKNVKQTRNVSSSPENALERIRAKYGKDGREKLLRKPFMVDAKPIDMEHNKKLSENCYGDFEKTLKEWITPATLAYLRTRGNVRGDLSDESDDDPLTEVQEIMQKFYTGDISIEKRKKKIKVEKAACKLRMPSVDSFDQHGRRVEVIMNVLKTGWKKLSDHLDSQEPIQVAKPLVATFGLTASNLDLDKFEKRICTALLFRLVSYCHDVMNENYFLADEPDSRFLSYLESIECEKSVYNRFEKFVFDQL